jgi:hypothetical protein
MQINEFSRLKWTLQLNENGESLEAVLENLGPKMVLADNKEEEIDEEARRTKELVKQEYEAKRVKLRRRNRKRELKALVHWKQAVEENIAVLEQRKATLERFGIHSGRVPLVEKKILEAKAQLKDIEKKFQVPKKI